MKNLFSLLYSKILFLYQSIVKNFSTFHLILVLSFITSYAILCSLIVLVANFEYIPYVISYAIFFFFLIIVYFILYNYCNIDKNMTSFLSFSLNNILFIIYIISISTLYKRLEEPIYIDNISIYTQYRYLFLLILSICLIFFYIFRKHYLDFYQKIQKPFLKEEIRKVLYIWNDGIFGPLFSSLINFLEKDINKKIFFLLHFFLFFLIRLILVLLLVNFAFFNGDLRYILYFLPISFISWLLSYLEYYFSVFFEQTKNYINSLIIVTPLRPLTSVSGTIYGYENDFSFSLTSSGQEEGYNIIFLSKLWFKLGRIDSDLKYYQKYFYKFSKLILGLQIYSWFTLVYYFFIKNTLDSTILISGKNGLFTWMSKVAGPFKPTTPLFFPPTEAFYVKSQHWTRYGKRY